MVFLLESDEIDYTTENITTTTTTTILCPASCSNVFQLPEGRMLSLFGIVPNGSALDVPNAALGVIYYTLWLLVLPRLPRAMTLVVSSSALASSVFLAIQLLILKELCILCWSTHVINTRLWFSAMAGAGYFGRGRAASKEKKIKRV
jgi:uncharacterized membrane protein